MSQFGTAYGLEKLGIENVGVFFTRGVLIDVAGQRGTPRMLAGQVITVKDLEGALAAQKVQQEAGLSDAAKLNREVIIWDLKTGNVGPKRFDISNPQSPYEVSQQDGSYFSIPDFLHSAHTIDNANDAEAYLSRLEQFATVLDNESAEVRRQAGRGYLAPGWSLDLALKQMKDLRAMGALRTEWLRRGCGGDLRTEPVSDCGFVFLLVARRRADRPRAVGLRRSRGLRSGRRERCAEQ